MDRSGRVVSKHIARSSGSATLDQAALAMLDRAQPLPAFPPSMREARKTLNLPVRFSVR
jgi:periplasmic protein TonB